MDEDYTVADFSSLTHYGVWYNLSVVRVEFTWYDVSKNKLLLILLDKDVSSFIYLFRFLSLHILYLSNILYIIEKKSCSNCPR